MENTLMLILIWPYKRYESANKYQILHRIWAEGKNKIKCHMVTLITEPK